MATVATVNRQGFETAIDFDRVGAREFEVTALDASGLVIGHSDRVVAD